MVAIHERSRRTYGPPRIHAELALDHGVRCGRKRVARIMRVAGIEGVHRRGKHRTTRRAEGVAPAPGLVERPFAADGPNRLWVADSGIADPSPVSLVAKFGACFGATPNTFPTLAQTYGRLITPS